MNKDLTAGKPEKVLWQFCLPLFGSIIFQQLYNIADSFVAGKFISDNALAAVGNSYEITLIFIAFAFGCNIACSVIAALFFGAKQYEDLLPFQHQQVKLRLLPVAEEEILADLLAEHGLDGLACLNRVRKVVVDTRIRNAQPIKQVIAALLLREALFKVFRSSFKYRFANVHFHHPARIARSTTVTSF